MYIYCSVYTLYTDTVKWKRPWLCNLCKDRPGVVQGHERSKNNHYHKPLIKATTFDDCYAYWVDQFSVLFLHGNISLGFWQSRWVFLLYYQLLNHFLCENFLRWLKAVELVTVTDTSVSVVGTITFRIPCQNLKLYVLLSKSIISLTITVIDMKFEILLYISRRKSWNEKKTFFCVKREENRKIVDWNFKVRKLYRVPVSYESVHILKRGSIYLRTIL